ncbi:PepSY-associated TM helix domain protein [Arcticibacter svalbardensis MN12-7]|uniref:PepSY-associated TM helix domain protein n=1 Tax=Arcticibacter svalbardensis MN12-7 TaxID=1150600 RepID=R9H1I3_9SPHI|nr:PepSY-associated TM helix domain protein [Arcticibacter svalbardensis MN12-7]
MWLGLSTGLIVFVISITGCIYVFEEEIRNSTQTEHLYVPVQKKTFIGLAKVISNFEHVAPKGKITLIRITEEKPNATVEINTGKKVYYFNPYNGSLVYEGKPDWLDTVQEIHTSLLLGESGKFIQRWSVVIFVLMLITGLILWFPNQMRLLRQSVNIKWKASAKRVNYDLHNVLGFYASGILIVIALSGLFFAFKEVKLAASFFTGTKLSEGRNIESLQPLFNKKLAIRYDNVYQTILDQYDKPNSTSISIRKTGELRLRMVYPYKWTRKQNTFFFDDSNSQLLRAKLYKDFNAADFIEATNYDLHTGKLFGLFSKVIACMASLIAASLPVTGFMIWWNKRRKPASKSL